MRSTATAVRTRRAGLVLGLAVAAIVAGTLAVSCSSDGSDPSPAAPTTTEPGATPTDAGDVPPDPADQVVWQERSGGGLVPVSVVAAEVPTLTVYADGRVFRADREASTRYDHPVPFTSAKVSKAALAGFLDEVRASDLFTDDADFGRPAVTDLPTTSVSVHLDGETTTVDVYALEASFEEDLSDAQVDARNGLRDLLAAGAELAADAEPWVPTRVRATDLGPVEPDTSAAAPPPSWPGPPFATFAEVPGAGGERCLVVEGPAAPEVFDAAVANPGIAFASGDDVREVVVAALLPGDPGCPS